MSEKLIKEIEEIVNKPDEGCNDQCDKILKIRDLLGNRKTLVLKSIEELRNQKFNIPSYQRGYRWKKQQVEDLLNDINEYAEQGDSEKSDFYCLQPVVVMKNGEKWDLIDGQQRLTTISLILKHLNTTAYEIEFERRINDSISEIDQYHIDNANKNDK